MIFIAKYFVKNFRLIIFILSILLIYVLKYCKKTFLVDEIQSPLFSIEREMLTCNLLHTAIIHLWLNLKYKVSG
jgi:hypothetical protein